MEKRITEITDLELANAIIQTTIELENVKAKIMAINAEVTRRNKLVQPS